MKIVTILTASRSFRKNARVSPGDDSWCQGPMTKTQYSSLNVGDSYWQVLSSSGPPKHGQFIKGGFELQYSQVPEERPCESCAAYGFYLGFDDRGILRKKNRGRLWFE